MIYVGIDPGNKQTAIVSIDDQLNVVDHMKVDNDTVKCWLFDLMTGACRLHRIGIECVACYGMAVGAEVFETAEWCGRIREFVHALALPEEVYRVYRTQAKMHLCGQTRAKDPNVRQAIIDRYEATGGGKRGQIGTKTKPGPLYGIVDDQWAALAVAITVKETSDSLTIFK